MNKQTLLERNVSNCVLCLVKGANRVFEIEKIMTVVYRISFVAIPIVGPFLSFVLFFSRSSKHDHLMSYLIQRKTNY